MKNTAIIILMVIFMIIPVMGVSCDSYQPPITKTTIVKLTPIKKTIDDMWDAFNEGNYSKALTYCTNYRDEDETIAQLAGVKNLIVNITIESINVNASGSSAIVEFTLNISGQSNTYEAKLVKIEGDWKIDIGEGFVLVEPIDNPHIPELTEI